MSTVFVCLQRLVIENVLWLENSSRPPQVLHLLSFSLLRPGEARVGRHGRSQAAGGWESAAGSLEQVLPSVQRVFVWRDGCQGRGGGCRWTRAVGRPDVQQPVQDGQHRDTDRARADRVCVDPVVERHETSARSVSFVSSESFFDKEIKLCRYREEFTIRFTKNPMPLFLLGFAWSQFWCIVCKCRSLAHVIKRADLTWKKPKIHIHSLWF